MAFGAVTDRPAQHRKCCLLSQVEGMSHNADSDELEASGRK